jgi:hypothetical protein
MSMKHWIVVASKDHLQRGLTGGFMQANHGKSAPLQRMHKDDWIIYYSPKLEFAKPEKCQGFTAIGQLTDETVYQFDMGGGFVPFRRNVNYLPCREASILPLIEDLSFIKDKVHRGAPFRFGTLQIPEADFRAIAARMLDETQIQVL